MDDERKVPDSALERMSSVPGGQDFARDLYLRSQSPTKPTPLLSKPSQQLDKRASLPPDTKLERVVRHYSTPHLRPTNPSRSQRSSVFNCVRLSPLLSCHLQTGRDEVPYKSRVVTSHPLDLSSAMPKSIKLLQRHCEEKQRLRRKMVVRRRKEEEVARNKSSQSREQSSFQLGKGLSVLGVDQSPCLQDVIKMRNLLRDRPQVSLNSVW